MVSSTRSRWSARRGLRSFDTSTSTRMSLLSRRSILASLVIAWSRNRSLTPVCRPLTMMSMQQPPFGLATEQERPTTCLSDGVCCLPFCHRYPLPTLRHRELGWHPPGRPGLRPHIRLLRVSQLCCHYCPSLLTRDIWTLGKAG